MQALRECVACVNTKNENMAEGTQDIFPTTKCTKSEVWSYFGFLKNAEGQLVEDSYPVCRTCRKKVAAKGSNTTNLLAHLRDHHPQLYSQCKLCYANVSYCVRDFSFTEIVIMCNSRRMRDI